MELTGLGLWQMVGALGAASAIVIVLYILKLRRRRHSVAFVHLWEQVLAERQTTRLFSQLRRWLSLLLALLIVALLASSLGDPRLAGATAAGRTLVVLLDCSASMQATDGTPTRLDSAIDRTREFIDGLGAADRMLIARMGATARPLTPLTEDPRILRASLEDIAAADTTADLAAGLRLAGDVLRGQSEPEVIVVSDGRLAPADRHARALREAGVRLSYASVGERGTNMAITAFSARRHPLDKRQNEVLVELWNPSAERHVVELTIFAGGAPVESQRLGIEAGERHRRVLSNVSSVDEALEARISIVGETRDLLPVDNRAYAMLPKRRRARILAVSAGNLYLQAALLLDEYLDVVEVAPADYPVEGHFDVTIFDGWVPPSAPQTHAIYIYPRPAEGVQGPFEIRGEVSDPTFARVDHHHPLTRWTALSDVNVSRALRVVLQPGDRTVAGTARTPLLVAGTREGRRIVAFTFDVRQSDLPLRVAWPLLLLNAIDWFVDEDAAYVSSYRTGDNWRIPAPAGQDTVTVVSPSGEEHEVPVEEGRAVFSGLETGLYRLRTAAGEDTFAANLGHSAESDIAPAPVLRLDGAAAEAPSAGRVGARRELWLYLIGAVFLIISVEWLSYHRRWTV